MEYKHDPQAFIENLAVWHSKRKTMLGFEIVCLTDTDRIEYAPVVVDYATCDIGYYTKYYTTWKGAFAAIGAALDKIDNED